MTIEIRFRSTDVDEMKKLSEQQACEYLRHLQQNAPLVFPWDARREVVRAIHAKRYVTIKNLGVIDVNLESVVQLAPLHNANQTLDAAAVALKKLEPNQQVFKVVGLVEALDEPADTDDNFVRAVRDALNERLELRCW